jgi:uncharacterized lipoprotein YbaY
LYNLVGVSTPIPVRRTTALLVVLAALLLAGCGHVTPPPEPLPSVTGTIALRTNARLPFGSILEIRLLDTTGPGDPVVVAERSDSNPGQPPLRFRMQYDPSIIDPARDYAVETRIVVSGRSRWVQPKVVPVITKGRPVLVEIVLSVAAGGP